MQQIELSIYVYDKVLFTKLCKHFLGCAALLLAQPHHPVNFVVFVFVFFCSFSTFRSFFIVVEIVDVAAYISDALQ